MKNMNSCRNATAENTPGLCKQRTKKARKERASNFTDDNNKAGAGLVPHFIWESVGFTLIELIVVVSVISLLSSVVLASLAGSRASARDARRFQDIRQIRNALEMYYNDHGQYPVRNPPNGQGPRFSHVSCQWDGRDGSSCSSSVTLNSQLSPYLSGTLPNDPAYHFDEEGSSENRIYGYSTKANSDCGTSGDVNSYTLFFFTETSSDPPEFAYKANSTNSMYCTTSP